MECYVKILVENEEWVIQTFFTGTRVSELRTKDHHVVVTELNQRIHLMMGLAKGQVLTSKMGAH